MKKQISLGSLKDYEDKEMCEYCEELADLIVSGYSVCRQHSKLVKRLTKVKEEEE